MCESKNQGDLISIVVPIYNVEQYLQRCLDSIIKQTYQNLQIILVDDGSTDNCPQICDEIEKKDNRIEVIHKKNGGLSDARNTGIEKSIGEFITFIDSDDYISKDYIEILHSLIMENFAQVSIIDLYKTSKSDESYKNKNIRVEVLDQNKAISEMLYSKLYSTSACGKLFQKSLFNNIEFPLRKYSEDLFTIYKVLNNASKIVYSNQTCYYYFRREGSIIVSDFNVHKLDVFEAINNIKRDLPSNDEIEKSISCQTVEAATTILQTNITYKEVKRYKLWELIKKNRCVVIRDKNAPKRVRGYSLLSYFGFFIFRKTLNAYYKAKWE